MLGLRICYLSTLLLLAGSCLGQRLLFTFHGTGDDELGTSVSAAGDVNKDGVPDIIVGAPHRKDSYAPGYAVVYSGRDGRVLHTFRADVALTYFGEAVAGAGDVNADGYSDLLVGARLDDKNGRDSGSAFVYSGKNGEVLYTLRGSILYANYGHAVSGLGDVNRDGYDDFIVGEPIYSSTKQPPHGRAFVHSGQDGKVLHLIDEPYHSEGYVVAAAGDMNRDGYADFIVTSSDGNNGLATVYSGFDGKKLYAFPATNGVHSAKVAGDVDGDGFDDIVIGAGQNVGTVRVFSGKHGQEILVVRASPGGPRIGTSVAGVGDLNKDGHADLATGSFYNPQTFLTYVRIISGKDGKTLYDLPTAREKNLFASHIGNVGDID